MRKQARRGVVTYIPPRPRATAVQLRAHAQQGGYNPRPPARLRVVDDPIVRSEPFARDAAVWCVIVAGCAAFAVALHALGVF